MFCVAGPPVRVSPHQAVSLALVLHELATNALKYGALSAPEGKVSISWNTALDSEGRRYMTLLWEESGGPSVVEPKRFGFGTRLIQRTFAGQYGGRAQIKYPTDGLRCVIELVLSQADEIPMLDLRSSS